MNVVLNYKKVSIYIHIYDYTDMYGNDQKVQINSTTCFIKQCITFHIIPVWLKTEYGMGVLQHLIKKDDDVQTNYVIEFTTEFLYENVHIILRCSYSILGEIKRIIIRHIHSFEIIYSCILYKHQLIQ